MVYHRVVLGPLLFLIYINDLGLLTLHGKLISFADDTSLVYSASNAQLLQKAFEEDEKILRKYFFDNKLILNVNKSCFISFGFKLSIKNQTIFQMHVLDCRIRDCDCPVLQNRDHAKYLGLTLDSNLTWGENSIELQKKLRKLNYLFYYLRDYFSKTHLLNIYTSIYESLFSFGIVHWGGAAQIHLKPLSVLQNSVLKYILKKPKLTETLEVYREAQKLEIDQLYIYRSLMFAYKRRELFSWEESRQYGISTRSNARKNKLMVTHRWLKKHPRSQAVVTVPTLYNKFSINSPDTSLMEIRVREYKRMTKDFAKKEG
jgi:hypothetical protein